MKNLLHLNKLYQFKIVILLLETHFITVIFVFVLVICAVNSLRDQLDDMKKRNQNSHISNEKNIHLQKQVSYLP